MKKRLLLATCVVTLCYLASTAAASAHPLGNFTINRFSRIEVAGHRLYVSYVLDMAEIPTFQAGHIDARAYANRLARSVQLTVNGKPAFMGYISPTQVNIETPDDTAVGPVNVVVTTSNGSSGPMTLNLAGYAPGLFPSGQGNYIAAQHADGSPVGGYTGSTPAKPGEVIILWGTGFGPSSPATPAGKVVTAAPAAPGNLTGITVTIGGVPATIQYAGITISGLAQINVTVPSSLANGDAPVVATVGGVQTQASATTAVHN